MKFLFLLMVALVAAKKVRYDGSSDAEEDRLYQKPDLHVYDWNNFNPYEEFGPELRNLANDCGLRFTCSVYSIGDSYEGNPMECLSVNGGSKPGIWMDSQTHANEWLSSATLMKLAHRLIRQYGSDAESTELMDNYNWIFCPMINPDGYLYTWTTDRMWQKNRGVNAGSSCLGTNLNRNWDVFWSGCGTSSDPCSTAYHGSAPHSEIEIQNVAAEIMRLGSQIHAFVTFHSYGEHWVHPWAWTCDACPDHDELYRVADLTANAVETTYNTTWTRGIYCDIKHFETCGVSIDWVYSQAGVPYSYMVELRGDTSSIPPPSEIQLSYDEIWNGLVVMSREI